MTGHLSDRAQSVGRTGKAIEVTVSKPLDGSTPSTIDLLRIPFVFSQDDLLTTAQFVKEADLRGYQVSETVLAELHEFDIMPPLVRIDDEPQAALRVEVARTGGHNPRGWVTAAVAEGRLRDPQVGGISAHASLQATARQP